MSPTIWHPNVISPAPSQASTSVPPQDPDGDDTPALVIINEPQSTAITVSSGPTGIQGVQGTSGIQGPYGMQGLQGPNAAITVSTTPPSSPLIGDRWVDSNSGVEYTWINDGSHSWWVETDASGYMGPQGLTGIQGPTGSGIQGIQGPNAALTFSATAPASPLLGDRWVDSNTGVEYTWINDGSHNWWVETDASGYVGAQGLAGIQGPAGSVQGVQGFQGPLGIQGIQGIQGTTGTQGFTGTQGTTGNQGLLGTQGLQGTLGLQGLQGSAQLGVATFVQVDAPSIAAFTPYAWWQETALGSGIWTLWLEDGS